MTGECDPTGFLASRFSRLGDAHFRRLIRWDIEARVLLRRQLKLLAEYHGGRAYDFTEVRNRYLSRIVRFAQEYSPRPAQPLHALGRRVDPTSSEWCAIPIVDKTLLREQMDSFITTPTSCPWVGHLTTGGSTGEPFGFPYMGGHDAEHQEFLWRLHGYQDGDRILAMDGTLVDDADVAQGTYWTRKSDAELPYGGTALSGHYLTSATRSAYLDYLLQSKPQFIRGYPSLVSEIASCARERGLHVGCKGVELSSESHTDDQVRLIESTLGPVFDQYGHAEASIFGYSLDSNGPVYCSPMYGLVEVLDPRGRHVPPGDLGEVVVTGFHNYAMPFIRYRTGDLAQFEGTADGIVRLTRVLGRTQDYVVSQDGEKHLLTALVFGRHYSAMAHIDRWQLVQEEPGIVVVRVDRGASYCFDDEEEIRRNFWELARVRTEFDYNSGINRSGRAKAPWVIQAVSGDER